MKIGIISDTHKKLKRAKRAVNLLKEKNCEWIIHAGDIVREELLEFLQETYKNKYIAVLGNNDHHLYEVIDKYNLATEPYYFKLFNHTFKLMHYPKHIFPLDTDIIIYGHTHDIDISFNGKNLIINPGEVCARDSGYSSCVSLEIKNDKYIVEIFYRKIKTDEWKSKIKEFLT